MLVEVLLNRFSQTPYHYATPKVGHLPPGLNQWAWDYSDQAALLLISVLTAASKEYLTKG